jgi:hypothetical protein
MEKGKTLPLMFKKYILVIKEWLAPKIRISKN